MCTFFPYLSEELAARPSTRQSAPTDTWPTERPPLLIYNRALIFAGRVMIFCDVCQGPDSKSTLNAQQDGVPIPLCIIDS